ncbi:MAG: hypothetical protein NT094_00870 [Candidatus Staskawiczbacteria bacterium]|nr:hypothetical protein [Candidatus Staskawiczbacteria bacterium]
MLEELFPSYKITCVTIVHNPAGIQGDNFSYSHEYAFFVYPSGSRYIGLQIREEDIDVRNFWEVSQFMKMGLGDTTIMKNMNMTRTIYQAGKCWNYSFYLI